MNRQLAVILLMLGGACAARAQNEVPTAMAGIRNVAAPFAVAPSTTERFSEPNSAVSPFPSPVTAGAPTWTSPLENTALDASPSPAPDPKYLYGGRDDFRWQLGIGVDWIRFRSSIFNASAVGIQSSVTYFTNEWFGVEGDVSTAFAPQIFDREHVKLLVYTVGPKIAWRQKKWEPYVHALVGGAHEQPQTAGNSRNAFALEAGGGADYRLNPRLSGRLEADWDVTRFFSRTQNNIKLMGGVVFHF